MERSVSDNLDERLVRYVFEGNGLELRCNGQELVSALFLCSTEYGDLTPGGRTITDHAARQMRNPSCGRVQASPRDVEAVLDGGSVRKLCFPEGSETLTIRNSSLPGSPDVVVDAGTRNRVITIIKLKEF